MVRDGSRLHAPAELRGILDGNQPQIDHDDRQRSRYQRCRAQTSPGPSCIWPTRCFSCLGYPRRSSSRSASSLPHGRRGRPRGDHSCESRRVRRTRCTARVEPLPRVGRLTSSTWPSADRGQLAKTNAMNPDRAVRTRVAANGHAGRGACRCRPVRSLRVAHRWNSS